jgi:hypothetical protein
MTINTKLSLYKLFRTSTIWALFTSNEYAMIMEWLIQHSYLTEKRTSLDNLFDTFDWFRVREGDRVWVTLGHITRLRKEIDARFPRQRFDGSNGTIRALLNISRNSLNGTQILAIKIQQFRGGSN